MICLFFIENILSICRWLHLHPAGMIRNLQVWSWVKRFFENIDFPRSTPDFLRQVLGGRRRPRPLQNSSRPLSVKICLGNCVLRAKLLIKKSYCCVGARNPSHRFQRLQDNSSWNFVSLGNRQRSVLQDVCDLSHKISRHGIACSQTWCGDILSRRDLLLS